MRLIADMGVKTILSVDGKIPDAEEAAKYGIRYVHVPIRYGGITNDHTTLWDHMERPAIGKHPVITTPRFQFGIYGDDSP